MRRASRAEPERAAKVRKTVTQVEKAAQLAPPAVPAPPSSSAFERLPLDLVRIILSHIPPRPRLSIISVVCRRWRSVALASLHSIHAVRPTAAAAALALLPAVTSMSVCSLPDPITIPLTLRKLCIFKRPSLPEYAARHDVSLCPCRHFCALSSLTDLSLVYYGSCDCAHTLLAANRASLATLELHMGGMVISRDTTRRYSALAALCESLMLPSLTSLALTVPGFTNEPMSRVYTSLLALHRQQLASLSMVVGRTHYLDTRMMLACGYPNLTECTLFGTDVRCAMLDSLLAGSPKLRNLSLYPDYEGGMELGALPRIATLLTCLQLAVPNLTPRGATFAAFVTEFATCTRLTKLLLRNFENPIWLVHAGQLQTLQVEPMKADYARLCECTSLRVLDVYIPKGLATLTIALPRLTDLYVSFEVAPPIGKVISFLRSLIVSCPKLEVLSLELPAFQRRHVHALEEAIGEAERAGLVQLCLCVLPDMVALAQQLKSKFRWLELEVALPAEQGPEILQIEDFE